MVSNYLLTALRNLSRHRLYSFINIAGLAVGLACVTFILLFLRDELTWDHWVPRTDGLYRLSITFTAPGRGDEFFQVVQFPLSVTMKDEIPEVAEQTHITGNTATAQVGERQFSAAFETVDPNFLRMIPLPFVAGNPDTALARPDSIVLSQSQARKYFGNQNALGKTIILGGTHTMIVTGILRDAPSNSIFADLMMVPNTSTADPTPPGSPDRANWMNVAPLEFLRLAPGANPDAVMAKLPAMLNRHVDMMARMHIALPAAQVMHPHLVPFGRTHLDPFGQTEKGRWTSFYGFAAIAALILLIAGINYMNLATARAIVRAREVSLRKVLGARRGQLIVQFLGESLLVALAALVLALALVELLLPAFDSLLNRPIAYQLFADWPLTLAILGVAVLAGIAGGVYPALVLSGFRPAANLGAGSRTTGGSGLLRNALVVLQFSVSIGLGIAAAVIFTQINYARALDLGFDHGNVVAVTGTNDLTPAARQSFRQVLAAEPSIAAVAQSDAVPFDGSVRISSFTHPGGTESLTLDHTVIDPDFLKLYGIKLVAGRNLTRDRGGDLANPADTANPDSSAITHPAANLNVLINQAAMRRFGFTPDNAVGQALTMQQTEHRTVVGVVADANFMGPQIATPPMVYFDNPNFLSVTSVRIKPGRTEEATAAIDRIWHRFAPSTAIQRRFIDAGLDRLFADDQRQGQIFTVFVAIAIVIACLGLFGLASFTAARRTKEMAIRKTHGARGRDIAWLMLWQFSVPVLIANAIAWPVAWYYLHSWLESYANRISLSPLYFVGAGAAALIIAWVTVIAHAAHAARTSPIIALRYE